MLSIYNEREYAENIIKNGFETNQIRLGMFILGKYFRFVHGLPQVKAKKKIMDICAEKIFRYEETDDYKKINRALKAAYSSKVALIEIEQISFSKKEVNYINKLKVSEEAKLVLFALWCFGKINKQAGLLEDWININLCVLKFHAGIPLRTRIIKVLNELVAKKEIFVSDKNAINLLTLHKVHKAKEAKGYVIKKFTNFGNYYRKNVLKIKLSILCENCGKFVDNISHGRVKYCEKCRVVVWNRQKEKINRIMSAKRTLENSTKYNKKI